MVLLLRLIGIGAGMLGLLSCPLFFHAVDRAPRDTAESECATDKIAFDQAQGCMNDGSVEFCIPANDPAALEAVRDIDPQIECMRGSHGRAGCEPDREILCLTVTLPYCTADRYGTINEAGWARICAFSHLPFIIQIVPTWYE